MILVFANHALALRYDLINSGQRGYTLPTAQSFDHMPTAFDQRR